MNSVNSADWDIRELIPANEAVMAKYEANKIHILSYFGLEDKKRGSVENGVKVFHSEYIKTDLEIFFGFQEKRIKRIMQNFFLELGSSFFIL